LGEGDEEAGEAGVEKPRLAVRTFNRAAGGGGLDGRGWSPWLCQVVLGIAGQAHGLAGPSGASGPP
jgi:hypothetical protein